MEEPRPVGPPGQRRVRHTCGPTWGRPGDATACRCGREVDEPVDRPTCPAVARALTCA